MLNYNSERFTPFNISNAGSFGAIMLRLEYTKMVRCALQVQQLNSQ